MEEYGWIAFVSTVGSIASITSFVWAYLTWLQKRKPPRRRPRIAMTAPKIVRLAE